MNIKIMKKQISLAIFVFCIYGMFGLENPLIPVKLDSPRDTIKSYMLAMNDYKAGVKTGQKDKRDRINDAIRCLNLDNIPFVLRKEKGGEAAILLKEVIDRVIVIDVNLVPDDIGDRNNPLQKWRLKDTEITISRVKKGEREGDYLFSVDTVSRAPEFFEKVKHLPYLKKSGGGALYKEPWVESKLPHWALEKTILLLNWQWLGILISIFSGLVIKRLIEIQIHLLKKFTQKTKFDWDDKIIYAFDRPAGLIGASGFWIISIFILKFEGTPQLILMNFVQVIFSISLIWLIYNSVDVLTEYLMHLSSKTGSKLDDQLVPLIQRALKMFVVVFGVLVSCQNLGFNVMSVLAGLGLGGLAFALAAKDTCANFFGSIMILLDRPFNIGDWVIIGKTEGSVEEIGFRSTRIRTFYDSLITVPNSILANADIDNMGQRNYRRIKAFFGLTYDTPPEKMEAFLEGVKNIVEANPYTRKDYYHVVFNGYGNFSLDVMLYCFLKVPDWAAELVQRQNIYLEILRLAEKIGVDFAFPTQTLQIESFPGHESLRAPHRVDISELSDAALKFGPSGLHSKPGGLGIFTPPNQSVRIENGSSNDGE